MFIYKTTNLINGMIYIGKRQKERSNYLGSGKYLKNAIKKYGKENFKREIIEDNIEDSKSLCEREKFWISFYKSNDKNIGYNLTNGGDGVCRGPLSEEHKKKISKALKGRVFSEEDKRKMSEGRIGMKFSEEHIKHMSERIVSKESTEKRVAKMKGRKASEETRRKMRESSNPRRGSQNSKSKLNEEQVLEIKKMLKDGITERKIAERYHVTIGCISNIKTGRNWKQVNLDD